MLALARSVTRADALMKDGRWEKKSLQGAELRGKTLGLVGLGRIGREVVRRARAFEMRIRRTRSVHHVAGCQRPRRRARITRRTLRTGRFHKPACAVDQRDPPTPEPRAAGTLQARRPHRQHRAGAASSTSRHWPRRWPPATSAEPGWTCSRRSRPRRTSSPACPAGGGDAAHRGLDAGGPGAGGARSGHRRPGFPALGQRPQRRQLSFRVGRRDFKPPAAVHRTRRAAGQLSRPAHGGADRERRHPLLRRARGHEPRTCSSVPCSSGCSARFCPPP